MDNEERSAELSAEAFAAVGETAASGDEYEDAPLGTPFGTLPGAAFLDRFMTSPKVEVLLALPVLFSCFLFAFSTLTCTPELFEISSVTCSPGYAYALRSAENGISAFFAAEYFIRWYSVSLRPGYLAKPSSLIDLLSFLPLLVQMMGGSDTPSLQFLRLLRVLRLQRYLQDYESFSKFYAEGLGLETSVRPYQLEVARVASSLFTLVFIATGSIYEAEHASNPLIPDFFTALYFGLTTLTTVGFGDITPVTFYGRLVVCFSILVGVAVVPVQLANLVEALANRSGGRGAEPPPLGAPPTGGEGKAYLLRDTNGDGVLNEVARAPSATWSYAEIGRAFALYDANRSGKLDYRELRAALRGMGATAEDAEVAQILRSYDEAGDGLLDLDEFTQLVRYLKPPREPAFAPPLAPPGAPVKAVGPYSPPLATSGGAAASEDGALLSFLLRRAGLTRKEALALMALEPPEEDEGGDQAHQRGQGRG